MHMRSYGRIVAGLTCTTLLALTACGGSSESAAPSVDTPVTVQAGFIPVIDVAALYLGIDKGFFDNAGIDLQVNVGQGGAALVPPVVSGEYQFAFSNMVSILTGVSKGLPLQVIGAGSSSTGVEGADVTMLHAPQDSGIDSPADLAGKRVSVNTVGNLLELLGRVAIDSAGGNSDDVQFVELGFPEAIAALMTGDIDAMVGAEPFGTVAIEDGNPAIASPYLDMSSESMLTSVYFTSQQQLAENPELFEAIRTAIDSSLSYAQEHPDEVRAQLPKFTQMTPEVIEKVLLPTFSPEIPKESVDLFIEYAEKYGYLDEAVSYDDLVWNPTS